MGVVSRHFEVHLYRTQAHCFAPRTFRGVCVRVQPQSTLRAIVMEGGGENKPCKMMSFAPIIGLPAVRPGSATNSSPESLASKPLALNDIRQSLMRQEDTIIYYLLERAQFCINKPAYNPDAFSIQGFEGSLVQYMLRETEGLHAKVRRYTSPDEHAFFGNDLPAPAIPAVSYSQVLHPGSDAININEDIWSMYFDNLLPEIAAEGDDGNYGSTATLDVLCLQALSKRIHYGKFVAESKFLEKRKEFESAIRDKDIEKLNNFIFFPATEKEVIERVEAKAKLYGQEVNAKGELIPESYRMPPHIVAALYRDWVMPLTKKVQLLYLLHRLD